MKRLAWTGLWLTPGLLLVALMGACGEGGEQSIPVRAITKFPPLLSTRYARGEDDRTLRIRYETTSSDPLARISVRETSSSVEVAIFAEVKVGRDPDGVPYGSTRDLVIQCVEVRLRAPLAGRAVIRSASSRGSRRALPYGEVRGRCAAPPGPAP